MSSILIRKARVIDPMQKLDKVMDVLIDNGVIQKLAFIIKEDADIVIDGTQKIVAPGFVDMHVHFRDPGFEYKEDIISGAKSAARGGFTSVACMPNTKPCVDNLKTLEYIKNKAKDALVHVYPVAAMTKGMNGNEICDYKELKQAGAIAVSDDGLPVSDSGVMLNVLREAEKVKLLRIAHCEDLSLAKGGVMNEGITAKELQLPGISNMSEYIPIMRDILLASPQKNQLHIAHVSTKESVRAIRWAKKSNPKITCETAPHYIALTEEAIKDYGVNAKMNPPLRTQEDVNAVIEGLRDGTIDVLATDHAPHSQEDKGTLLSGANGIVGLETAFALNYTYLVETGKMSIRKLIRLMSTNPAKILGIDKGTIAEGKKADVVIFDTEEWMVDKNQFASKSNNTPFDQMKLKGRILYTIVDGNIVYDNSGICESSKTV